MSGVINTSGASWIRKQIRVTSSQILGMYATPVQLTEAPPTGYTIVLAKVLYGFDWTGGTQYTSGGNLAVQYGNTIHGAGNSAGFGMPVFIFRGVNSRVVLHGATISPPVILGNLGVSKALYWSNITQPLLSGDYDVVLTLYYANILALL